MTMKARDIPGLICYELETSDRFPTNAEELDEYIKKILSSIVEIGQPISHKESIIHNVERRVNNILMLARQRDVIDEVLYCWASFPNETSLNIELKKKPRPTPQLQQEDRKQEDGWSKEEMLEYDLLDRLLELDEDY